MRNVWSDLLLFGGATAVATLVGCSNWSPQTPGYPLTSNQNVKLASAASADIQGGSFQSALAAQYSGYSQQLYQQGDFADADYYGRKGHATATGSETPPEDNAHWAIPLESPPYYLRTTLATARTQLVSALDGGATARAPVVAAKAQKSYDCWVTDTQRNWPNINASPCRADFEQAMVALSPRSPPPLAVAKPSVQVLFATDQAVLNPAALQTVSSVAATLRADPSTHVSVVGKTDTVGASPYNMTLSERRAEAVRAALTAAGVPPAQIDARYTGEDQLNVPTPDNTPEAANRAVDIRFQ